MNYKEFFESNCTYNLSDVYKIMTKKYFRGRNNKEVHYKTMKKINFRNAAPNTFSWKRLFTNKPQSNKVSMVLGYSEQYWPDKGYINFEITNQYIKLHTFDIIDMRMHSESHFQVDIETLRQYGELTESAYFMISTAHNLYGLSFEDCHDLLRIVDLLVDLEF